MSHVLNSSKQFYVIEGPDGVGKTTLINKIKESALLENHEPIFFTAQPTKTQLGNFCRELSQKNVDKKILCELFFLDRLQHQQVIKENLKTHHVICDRYFHSSFVYQDFDHSKLMLQKYDILLPHKTFMLVDDPQKINERKNLRKTGDVLDLLDTQDLLTKYQSVFNELTRDDLHKIEIFDVGIGIEQICRLVLESISRSKNQ